MKVLNISRLKLNDKHNYYGGAIGNIAYNLMRSLAELGVEIVTFTEGVDLEREPPENLKFIEAHSFREILQKTSKLLNEEKFQVVTHFYFHEPEFNPAAKFVKRRGIPFVIGMCELPHPRLNDEVDGILKIRLVRTIGRYLVLPKFKETLRLCDGLIVVNEAAKAYYGQFVDEGKIRVIPYGVDLERFRYTPLPETPRILTVSRLIKRRGVDYLVRAMPEILRESPKAELHFVGEGARKEILRKLAEKLGVASKVFFHGNVPAEELVRLYRDCYVFCHLSFADGWNQPALEAMATGRPVVCTNAPHNSMVKNGKTGFLIPFGKTDMLTEKMIYLFENYKLAEEMGVKGRKRAENEYNWSRIAKAYYNVFQEVIS